MMTTNKTTDGQQPVTLLQACDSDLQKLKLRVGIDRTMSTYTRQCRLRQMAADYISYAFNADDVGLDALNVSFMSDYASYLSTHCHLLDGTVWLACQWLKGVVGRAVQRGWLDSNPFVEFHIGRNIRPREYLSEDELKRLIACDMADSQLAFFRDVFVFSALTGLSFADINHLSHRDIRLIGRQYWIMSVRHKTHTPYQVRLLPQAADIVSRYHGSRDRIFGPITYRTLAKHIPLIVQQCGISRHVTFHSARHTFAVMCLDAGLPIESISRMLGHTNISTTQIYARITLEKLSSDMDCLQSFCQQRFDDGAP